MRASRNTAEDPIDYSAGILLRKKTGDLVSEGEEIATLFSNDPASFAAAEEKLLAATVIEAEKPADEPLVYDVIE